jgi:hypothetical protein
MKKIILLISLFSLIILPIFSQKKTKTENPKLLSSKIIEGMEFRNISGQHVGIGDGIYLSENRKTPILTDTLDFEVKPLREASLEGASVDELKKYWDELSELHSQINVFIKQLKKSYVTAEAFKKAYVRSNQTDFELYEDIHKLMSDIQNLQAEVYGSPSKREVGEKKKETFYTRFYKVYRSAKSNMYGPTGKLYSSLQIAVKEFEIIQSKLEKIRTEEIPLISSRLKEVGAPDVEGVE